jgi:inosine-uridine nucleoside N-ribohydrolase
VEVRVWELSISHIADKYSFTLNNPSAGGLSFRETMHVPAAVRDDIVARTSGGLSPADDRGFGERLAEAGRDVFQLMLPRSIQDVLTKLEGGHLAISTDDPAILWESAFFKDEFLGLRFAVARRMIARKVPDQKPRPERSSLEMLVIADPRADLRQAGGEAHAIEEMFAEESLVQVRVLAGNEASTRNVLNHLGKYAYDIVHYAGHVDANEPGEATLKLADDDTPASYLAQRLPDVKPQIVFVNGCSSGRLATQVEENPHFGGEWVASMAETFLTEGVGSYVGTLWDVADDTASKVAGRFYAALLEGAAVGDALMSARQSVADLGAAGWGAYLLYGRPNEMIAGIRPVIERRRNMSGLRKLIASDNEVERRQAAIRLGKLGLNEATKELAAACHDPSQAVRWRAVEGLAKIGTPAAITALAEYLGQADRDSVLQVLVVARGKFGTEHWDAVSSLANPPHDRFVRANAIAALTWIAHDAHKSRMTGFLADDDPLIQWAALNGLARLGSLADPVLQTYQPDDLVLENQRQRILAARRPAAVAPRVAPSDRAVPIILDCDAGLDDSAAIALAALHADCSLQAVSIVGGGNATVADGVETASAVLQLCERDDVPVLAGIGRGAGQVAGERSKVFEQLADVIMRHEGRCAVVATGPLTNVAVLLQAFPQLVSSVKEIVFLGCSFSASGNAGPVQEANVFADPEAAHAVFRSGARIKIVPLGVSQQFTVGEADAEKLGSPGGRLLNQQLAVMLAPLLAYYRVVFGRDSCPMHDPVAVLLALRPDLFSLRRMAVAVELTGDLTRGMTVRDDRPEAEGDNLASAIEIAEAVDLGEVRELLTRILEAPTPQ